MAVESVTTISDLNELWPLGTDPRSEGDDHIRNVKKALKAQGGIVFVARQVKTTTGAITLNAGTKAFLVEVLGGGGGGGNCPNGSTANNGVGAGGGGAGGYASKWIVRPTGTYTPTCTIGAGGGSTVNGSQSVFSDGTNTLTANGGTAGTSAPTPGQHAWLPGGVGGSAAGGDINRTGEMGDFSFYFTTNAATTIAVKGGGGGSSQYGVGGAYIGFTTGSAQQATGSAGSGYAAGGGGGISMNGGTAIGGGAGTAGVVIITEFR